MLSIDATRIAFSKIAQEGLSFADPNVVTGAIRDIVGDQNTGQDLTMTRGSKGDGYRVTKVCLTMLEISEGLDPLVVPSTSGRCVLELSSTTGAVPMSYPFEYQDGSTSFSSYWPPLQPVLRPLSSTATTISVSWDILNDLQGAALLKAELQLTSDAHDLTLEYIPTANTTFEKYVETVSDLSIYTSYTMVLKIINEAGSATSEPVSWSTQTAFCDGTATTVVPAVSGYWKCVELQNYETVRCNPTTQACECTTDFVELEGQRSCPLIDSEVNVCNADVAACEDSGGQCNLRSGICMCGAGYGTGKTYLKTAANKLTCENRYVPCSESKCLGEFGTCNPISGICDCNKKDTSLSAIQTSSSEEPIDEQLATLYAAGSVPDAWRLCVLDIASSDDQRKFWAISLWLSAWGLLASILVIWEFVYNTQLKHPNTMMQGFVAFAVPDFAMSALNFIFFIDCLVDGDPLGSVTGTDRKSVV